ncbi:DUF664 domain-containing protein [Streptomyces sp. Act-28]
MTAPDPGADLRFHPQPARDAPPWKLEGLSKYDVHRPLTPTGTDLLGMVKHATGGEPGYLGDTFGRPSGEPLPWPEAGAVGTSRGDDSMEPGDSARWESHRSRWERMGREADR